MATGSHELVTKQKIVDVIQRMPENGTIDDAINRLKLLKAVADGLKDVEDGLLHDHEAVFDELLTMTQQSPMRSNNGFGERGDS